MPPGRPQKRSRNTSGLRHQSCNNTPVSKDEMSSSSDSDAENTPVATSTNGNDPGTLDDEVLWDMKKSHIDEEEELVYKEAGDDTDVEEISDSEGFWEDEDLQDMLIALAIKEGENLKDGDWLPPKQRKKKKSGSTIASILSMSLIFMKSLRTHCKTTSLLNRASYCKQI
jgi:hypothetical protein